MDKWVLFESSGSIAPDVIAFYTMSAHFQKVLNGKWDSANKDSLLSFAVTEIAIYCFPISKSLLADSAIAQSFSLFLTYM